MKNFILLLSAIAVVAGCDKINLEANQARTEPDNPPLVLAQAASTGASAPQPAPPRGEVVPLPDFTPLMKIDGPAVVNVITVNKQAKNSPRARGQGGGAEDDPMLEFFRRFMPGPGGPGGDEGDQPRGGLGSGFIVSSDGYILTNAHVVDGAKDVDVKLTDRREFVAKVIGSDPKTDVALIKIDARGLPVVHIGNPREVKPGQWVVAVGSPFGFENSVTAGIVSAKSRSLSDSYVPFIQTDVAVNPGNSGGPLFDMNGNVVGINSQIYSQTGGYMGLSFAIPIDVAMRVKDELQQHGKVTRGRIGVTIQPVNQRLAQSFGLGKPEGALVSSVEDGSPAARAGLKPGDVILAWNGAPIDESAKLPVLVADTQPGKNAQMKVWRDGHATSLDVKVAAMADSGQKVASADKGEANSGRLGLAVEPTDQGLVVQDASGPAAAAGVQEGDVILAVNSKPVKTVQELKRLVSSAGKHVALLVQRNDSKIFVPVDLG